MNSTHRSTMPRLFWAASYYLYLREPWPLSDCVNFVASYFLTIRWPLCVNIKMLDLRPKVWWVKSITGEIVSWISICWQLWVCFSVIKSYAVSSRVILIIYSLDFTIAWTLINYICMSCIIYRSTMHVKHTISNGPFVNMHNPMLIYHIWCLIVHLQHAQSNFHPSNSSIY